MDMKKLKVFFIILTLIPILFSCGNIPEEAKALTLSADLNRGPCVTNYNRAAPGVCIRNVSAVVHSASSNTCQTTTVSELPTNAKSVILQYQFLMKSSNAIALRTASIVFYASSDTTCVGSPAMTLTNSIREFAAVAANTDLQRVTGYVQLYQNGRNINTTKIDADSSPHSYFIEVYGYTD